VILYFIYNIGVLPLVLFKNEEKIELGIQIGSECQIGREFDGRYLYPGRNGFLLGVTSPSAAAEGRTKNREPAAPPRQTDKYSRTQTLCNAWVSTLRFAAGLGTIRGAFRP
jgi:hypothetical protein